jgi:predicted small secreted protein
MTKIVKILSLFALAFSLGACNTISGIGQDLQNLGRTMENSGTKEAPKSDANSSGVVVTPVR